MSLIYIKRFSHVTYYLLEATCNLILVIVIWLPHNWKVLNFDSNVIKINFITEFDKIM